MWGKGERDVDVGARESVVTMASQAKLCIPPMSTFALNCMLLNDDPTKVFTVKVPESENVSILKELIKAKKAPHLDHLAASDLILWKVRLSP